MVRKDQGRTGDANTGVWQYAAYANTVMDEMQRMRGDRGVYPDDRGGGAGDVSVETPMVYQVRPSLRVCDVPVVGCTRLRATHRVSVFKSDIPCSPVPHSR